MDEKKVQIWQPIEFSENWRQSDASILNDLAPSWFKKRRELAEGNADYEEFIERLKRQHSIETGIVEKIYDLSTGITETFIKEGFVEAYLSHEDTNIPTGQLIAILQDHLDAMDFIFDMVKNERPLSISIIKQLHQIVTKNQDYTTGINSLGQKVQIKLLKGQFKIYENNPKREDGTIYSYCPPIHVDSEMEKLISIYTNLWGGGVDPVIIAAWIHHAFAQIHPFQDGNGRLARLLASLILIKANLFPFTVKRNQKVEYIDALEAADNSNPQMLVTFFCQVQKSNIENALNFRTKKKESSISDVAKLFGERVEVLASKKREQKQEQLEKNRSSIFNSIYDLLGNIQKELFTLIPKEKAKIKLVSVQPRSENYFWYTQQIAEYATKYDYYFNRFLPRGWFRISFIIAQDKRYDLIISVHHYSFEESVIAIGAFLEFTEDVMVDGQLLEEKNTIPINLKPYTISLENDPGRIHNNLDQYIRDVVKVGMIIITNEIV